MGGKSLRYCSHYQLTTYIRFSVHRHSYILMRWAFLPWPTSTVGTSTLMLVMIVSEWEATRTLCWDTGQNSTEHFTTVTWTGISLTSSCLVSQANSEQQKYWAFLRSCDIRDGYREDFRVCHTHWRTVQWEWCSCSDRNTQIHLSLQPKEKVLVSCHCPRSIQKGLLRLTAGKQFSKSSLSLRFKHTNSSRLKQSARDPEEVRKLNTLQHSCSR